MTNYTNYLRLLINKIKKSHTEIDALTQNEEKINYKKLLKSINNLKELLIDTGKFCEEIEQDGYNVPNTIYDNLYSDLNTIYEIIDINDNIKSEE